MYSINGKQRRHLKSLAHPLKAVVQIGGKGLTPTVWQQIDEQLEIHELIKVKVGQGIGLDKDALRELLAAEVRGEIVQKIGRTLIVYRPREKDPDIRLPPVSG